MEIGVPELVIFLVVVVLLFGYRRLGEVAGEPGKGIRNFREGFAGKDGEPPPQTTRPDDPKALPK